ncbi:UNVERIFIED_ORG: hypothetical protein HNP28_002155 [Comamonas terrigena]
MIYLFFGIIYAGWLIPNHYFPWLAGWSDATSIIGLILLTIYSLHKKLFQINISILLFIFFGLIFSIPWVQLLTNHIHFLGDAVMVSLYAALGLLACILGKSLANNPKLSTQGLTALSTACATAAILSTGVALAQWTGAVSLGIYGADLPTGERPFGNVAQANHFNTLCFLGICALFFLYEQLKIEKLGFFAGTIFLLIGMILAQSRTGWLQVGFLIIWGFIQHLRMRNRIEKNWLILFGGLFSLGIFSLNSINKLLLLDPGRALSDQVAPGARPAYWFSMLDALNLQPWWGYGWQQIGAAQQNIAIDHPPSPIYFEHSHNLVLDLMLWNGIPIGLLLTTLLVLWLYRQIRSYTQPHTGWLLVGLMGLGIHGLLEFPLEYAYFLIPAGLLMGFIEGSTSQASIRVIAIPRKIFACGIVAVVTVSSMVASEWLAAEANYRTLRFESARIGQQEASSSPPDLLLLTQLNAFLTFARTEATPAMSPEQVEWMRQVAARFGYPPVMFRYALAAGLSGKNREAEVTLQRICHIHGRERCTEAQEGWEILQQRFPQLQQISGPSHAQLINSWPPAIPPTSPPASPAP